jgi:hypothetical protein
VRRTLHANADSGRIAASGVAVVLPTGKEARGLGSGVTVVEPFAMYGQTVGVSGFLQLHAGAEISTNRARAPNEMFLRGAFGFTAAQNSGAGRAWTPMAELLIAKPTDGDAEWDVVPQMQVSLSALQHVLLSVGVRIPMTAREDRPVQVMTYVLWDWFDGGLFQFWR